MAFGKDSRSLRAFYLRNWLTDVSQAVDPVAYSLGSQRAKVAIDSVVDNVKKSIEVLIDEILDAIFVTYHVPAAKRIFKPFKPKLARPVNEAKEAHEALLIVKVAAQRLAEVRLNASKAQVEKGDQPLPSRIPRPALHQPRVQVHEHYGARPRRPSHIVARGRFDEPSPTDVTLDARTIYEVVSAYVRQRVALHCALNPADSLGNEPSVLHVALQCVGKITRPLPQRRILTQ